MFGTAVSRKVIFWGACLCAAGRVEMIIDLKFEAGQVSFLYRLRVSQAIL